MDSDLIINRDTIPDYNTLYVYSPAGFRKKGSHFFLYSVTLIQILAPTFNAEKMTKWFPKRILVYDYCDTLSLTSLMLSPRAV